MNLCVCVSVCEKGVEGEMGKVKIRLFERGALALCGRFMCLCACGVEVWGDV